MPYMVRVGAIDTNVSGVGSRGYAVFRSGRRVTVWFGKIEVRGSGVSRFYWCRQPSKKKHPLCKTVEQARALARDLIQEQLRDGVKGSYLKLPPNVRIRSHKRRGAATA
jgi:hypothetical protein